jgi:membrane protease subunit (stomatin/prohibitin family)
MADIFQIVKYEGDNTTFIWKSPIEDFNTGTQLIVHESQEAVFFMNGQALDLFGAGRYTLETQNIPLVRKFLNKPTDDQTPFHCEVYFINKTEQMSIKWGTDSQVQYMEPTYKFPLKIGASGEMSLRVEDSRKLMVKIVGTEHSLGQTALTSMFRAFLMAKVKPYLAQTMQNSKFGIFEVDSHMGELSEVLHKQLVPDFMDYGISLERFFVTNIVKPDGDKAYEKFRDIHIRQYSDIAEAQLRQKVGIIDQQTSAQKMVIESQAMATKRAQEGYTYQHERGFDVAEKVAQNESVANFTNTGIGLGMMGGMAGGMGSVVAGITTDALNPLRPQQGGDQNNVSPPIAGFGVVIPPVIDLKNETPKPAPPVPQSATPSSASPDDITLFKQKLEKLKMMKDMGMLSDADFEAEKKKLLSGL